MASKFLYKSNHIYKYAKTPTDIILFFKNIIFIAITAKLYTKRLTVISITKL